ncbi:MAG TPA: two-component regulator propeller domain-containing protein [Arenimonas sp.]|nr:two-component regulator propeller domain-containing protein [Arenimonas sp.]
MMIRWFWIACFSIFATLTLAQTPLQGKSQYRLLDYKDGLPSPVVQSIAQDKTGYLWIGTKDGLARFDGKQFKVFRHIPGDAQSLPSNFVQSVHVDSQDRIWLGIEGYGLYRYNRNNSSFTAVPLFAEMPSTPADIWAICSDAQGSVWLGTFGQGLFRIKPDGSTQHFMPNANEPSLPDENVLSLALDKQGVLWIATSSGIVQWKNEKFSAFDNALLSSKVVINLMPDIDFGMWIATSLGLDLVKPDGQVEKPVWRDQLSDQRIMAVLVESKTTRLFVARKGLNKVTNGTVEQIRPNDKFLTAFKDQSGGFWFGGEQGLLRQPLAWRYFKTYQSDDGSDQTLRNKIASDYHIMPDGSLLIVGTSGAIDRFWPVTGEVQHINSQESMQQLVSIDSVMVDQSGAIWAGAKLGNEPSLVRFDADATKYVAWSRSSEKDAGLLGPVKHIVQTDDGVIWVSYYGGGIQARDSISGQILYSITPDSKQGLKFPDPEQLFIGPDRALWLAGGEGLLRWSQQDKVFLPVKGSPQERVYSVHLPTSNTMWLGRLGLLEAYDWKNNTLKIRQTVSGDEGLPAVDITGINSDKSGRLWLNSSRGLMRYDPQTKHVRLYSMNDGLLSHEFTQRPPYISADGQALVLNSSGLIGFTPAQMSTSSPTMRLIIESVSMRRAEDLFQLDASKTIVLQPNDRDLTIEALLLNFDDVDAHRFRSKLSGYDPDWVEMGNSGKRVFSSLPAGSYQLEIIAASAEGVWSKPVVLRLNVLPPIWLTWWAFVLYVALFVLASVIVVLIYRARLKRKHMLQLEMQRNALVLKASESKSQFLADLGHEIRTPMTGVLGMAELLLAGELPAKPKSQVTAIKKAGEHLLRLMNDALDLSKIESGLFELDNQVFNLHTLLQEIHALLEPSATQKGLNFELQIDQHLGHTFVGDSGRIRQILFNLGTNAIKFTQEGYVIIRAQRLWPKGVMVSVVDSGPGMDKVQQSKLFKRFVQVDGVETTRKYGGSGLGLAISREFSRLMGGDIQVSSEPDCGTTFSLNLPLEQADEQIDVEKITKVSQPMQSVSSQKILLVEDDETIQQVISDLLQADGHEVAIAKNALEALAQTMVNKYTIIFCDIDLPGMSGFVLTQTWRSQGIQTPVVALTARTQSDTESLCFESGMNYFLRKPVNGKQLQVAISKLSAN